MNYDEAFKRLNEYPRYKIYPDGVVVRDAYEDVVRHPKGSFVRPYPEKEVSPEVSNCGYLRVRLYNRKLERKALSVHRLVATAFLNNPENLPCVNHKDGNKLNNHVDNLEWVTHSDNTKHGFSTGLIKIVYGEETANHKLLASQVSEIRARLSSGEVQARIAEYFGVSQATITSIKKKETWRGL